MNWFRKDQDGKFIWPGYGENMRILKWMIDCVRGRATRRETPLGFIPRVDDLDLAGLNISAAKIEEALAINKDEWRQELESAAEFFKTLEPNLPKALELQRQMLLAQLA